MCGLLTGGWGEKQGVQASCLHKTESPNFIASNNAI
jgi:hypothetical protein